MSNHTTSSTEYRICAKCKERKLATTQFFSRHQHGGLESYCRVCASERSRQWYYANRDRALARIKAAQAANPIPSRLRAKEWVKHNPERARDNAKRWRLNNIDRARAIARGTAERRLARSKGLEASLTAAEWQAILEYYDNACAYCGRSDCKLEQEHVIPVSQGGGYTKENIVPACGPCNRKKHAKTPEQAGMKLRQP